MLVYFYLNWYWYVSYVYLSYEQIHGEHNIATMYNVHTTDTNVHACVLCQGHFELCPSSFVLFSLIWIQTNMCFYMCGWELKTNSENSQKRVTWKSYLKISQAKICYNNAHISCLKVCHCLCCCCCRFHGVLNYISDWSTVKFSFPYEWYRIFHVYFVT